MNHTAGAIVFLHAQTAIHAGSGSALGVVDLPIQRERHTLWPILPGSSLKGVFRDAVREEVFSRDSAKGLSRKQSNSDELVTSLFGPDTAKASEHSGALSVADGRLLCFPVRSLKGVHAWVTCPAVLERFRRDARIAGAAVPAAPVPDLKEGIAAFQLGRLDVDGKIVLEEFEFARATEEPREWSAWLAERIFTGGDERRRFSQSFVVLADDDFTHFARHATEVVARIGLDAETKTVKEGALFYQEFAPSDCVFYSVILASRGRGTKQMSPAEVLGRALETLTRREVIQVGGDETIGRGFCFVRVAKGGN